MRRLGGVTASRRPGGVPGVMDPAVKERFDRMQSFKPQSRGGGPGMIGPPDQIGGPGPRLIGPPATGGTPTMTDTPTSGRGGGLNTMDRPNPPSNQMPAPAGFEVPLSDRQGSNRQPQPGQFAGGQGFQGFDPAVAFNRPLGMGMGGFGGIPPWMQGGGFGQGFGGGMPMPWQQGGGQGFGGAPPMWGGGMGMGMGPGQGFQPQPFQI